MYHVTHTRFGRDTQTSVLYSVLQAIVKIRFLEGAQFSRCRMVSTAVANHNELVITRQKGQY